MNDSERRAVEQVRVLWPHLTLTKRLQWVERLKYLFGDDALVTTRVLRGEATASGQGDGPPR